jgi:predicted DsbA family dithiol-disulfide isomerase
MATLSIRHYTDPACPWAFSAEPARYRLRWHYGDQLEWHHVMIVLTEDPDDYVRRGFTPELMAQGMTSIQRRYGMPIDPRPRERLAATAPACRAVVAARLHAPAAEEALLRALRVRAMGGGVLDDPAVLRAAVNDAGLAFGELEEWLHDDEVEAELRADMRAARTPSAAALALDHKLAGPPEERRYTAPSYEICRFDGGGSLVIPGFNPIEAYEAAIANLAPELERRPKPETVEEVLEWAGEPLATAEVALLLQRDAADVRAELARVAHALPAGADAYWTLELHALSLAA